MRGRQHRELRERGRALSAAAGALCRALPPRGRPAPDTLRRARFDRPQASLDFWRLLYALLKQIHRGRWTESDAIDNQIRFVKSALWYHGYDRPELYQLPADGSVGSRELLLAFSWMLHRLGLLERLLARNRVKTGDETSVCTVHIVQFDKSSSVARYHQCDGNRLDIVMREAGGGGIPLHAPWERDMLEMCSFMLLAKTKFHPEDEGVGCCRFFYLQQKEKWDKMNKWKLFAYPFVIVSLPDGEWRLTVDYPGLNEVTPPLSTAVPDMLELQYELEPKAARWCTTADMADVFSSIPLAAECRPQFAFTWRGVQYTWN
ncbi:hypothetical protein BTVI_70615 [Pitangus sulphuratus]|nr:hypothetical protein BTVI_70615 [Pitangus sulphuratus]